MSDQDHHRAAEFEPAAPAGRSGTARLQPRDALVGQHLPLDHRIRRVELQPRDGHRGRERPADDALVAERAAGCAIRNRFADDSWTTKGVLRVALQDLFGNGLFEILGEVAFHKRRRSER